MIPMGLSTAELRTFHTVLASSHSIKVTVQVLDLNHRYLFDLSSRLLDGQVNVDSDAEITRSLSVSILDPERKMHFDTNSPEDGSVFLDRMLKVVYSVRDVDTTSRWFDVPIFCGPVSKVERSDDVLAIEAQGKEVLASGVAWYPRSWKAGWTKAGLIKQILSVCAGETRFTIIPYAPKTNATCSLARGSVPWDRALGLAHAMGKQLFYDGRGIARLRSLYTRTVYTFTTGDGGTITGYPNISYSGEDKKNMVLVKGGIPKGAKTPIDFHLPAPASHPLSPWKLGRNGVPRFLLDVIEDDTITSERDARAAATSRLNSLLTDIVEVTVDSLPVPHIEPLDVVAVKTPEFTAAFRIRQFSIPLSADQTQSNGYRRKVSDNAKRIRRR